MDQIKQSIREVIGVSLTIDTVLASYISVVIKSLMIKC